MKKMLKLLSAVIMASTLMVAPLQASAVFEVMLGVDAGVLRPPLAPAIPDVPVVPNIVEPAPVIFPQPQVQQMKYNPDKNRFPSALRKQCNTRKEAYERALRDGNGNEPRHDPNGHPGKPGKNNKKPHFHPDSENPAISHRHYYYQYHVVAGDTLSGIAKKYNTTYKKLAEINGIENPNFIRVGQVIKIPK